MRILVGPDRGLAPGEQAVFGLRLERASGTLWTLVIDGGYLCSLPLADGEVTDWRSPSLWARVDDGQQVWVGPPGLADYHDCGEGDCWDVQAGTCRDLGYDPDALLASQAALAEQELAGLPPAPSPEPLVADLLASSSISSLREATVTLLLGTGGTSPARHVVFRFDARTGWYFSDAVVAAVHRHDPRPAAFAIALLVDEVPAHVLVSVADLPARADLEDDPVLGWADRPDIGFPGDVAVDPGNREWDIDHATRAMEPAGPKPPLR